MAEYIEREAAIKRFTFATLDCLGMEPTIMAADVVKALKAIPAADVVPVRHGRWEKVTSLMHQFGYYLGAGCSICGKTHYFLSGEMISNYCPNCGARMDLVTDCNQVKDGDEE